MPGECYHVVVGGLGIGSWSTGQLVAYLRDGSDHQVIASGPMVEDVVNSTSHMPECGPMAIATYLIDEASVEEPASMALDNDNSRIRMGGAIYKDTCVACPGDTGRGALGLFPKLAGHPAFQQVNPSTLIRVVPAGVRGGTTDLCPTAPAMPPLGWKLDDSAIASVLTFTRNAWGNVAPPNRRRRGPYDAPRACQPVKLARRLERDPDHAVGARNSNSRPGHV